MLVLQLCKADLNTKPTALGPFHLIFLCQLHDNQLLQLSIHAEAEAVLCTQADDTQTTLAANDLAQQSTVSPGCKLPAFGPNTSRDGTCKYMG